MIDFNKYKNTVIAHRGIHDNKEIPENSLKAFKLSIENNLTIELDIQLTKDNHLIVFHDANLKRMTGIDKQLSDDLHANKSGIDGYYIKTTFYA